MPTRKSSRKIAAPVEEPEVSTTTPKAPRKSVFGKMRLKKKEKSVKAVRSDRVVEGSPKKVAKNAEPKPEPVQEKTAPVEAAPVVEEQPVAEDASVVKEEPEEIEEAPEEPAEEEEPVEEREEGNQRP